MNPGAIEIDATNAAMTYNIVVTIDMTKPFSVAGGLSYNTKVSVEFSNGDRVGNVSIVNIINANGYYSYDPTKEGKANICLNVSEHPGLANFVNALHSAYTRACEANGLNAPQHYISTGEVDKDGKPYSDTIFIKVFIDQNSEFNRTIILVKESKDSKEGFRPLLSSNQVDESTLSSYAKKCLKDTSLVDTIREVYGREVKVNKKTQQVTLEKSTRTLKNTGMLLECSEFKESTKSYSSEIIQVRMKNLYVDKNNKTFGTLLATRSAGYKRVSNSKVAADSFDRLLNSIVEEVKPEDLEAEDVLSMC